jgi:general secretion pathway protein F
MESPQENRFLFKYFGVDKQGAQVSGTEEARSSEELSRELAERGITAYSLTNVSVDLKKTARLTGITSRDLAEFTRLLSELVRADLPLSASLRTLAKDLRKKSLVTLLEEMAAEVDKGSSLAEAAETRRGIFPEFYIEAIRAGEASGNLAPVLEQISSYSESLTHIKTKVVDSLIYPLFLSAFVIILHIFLYSKIISDFREIIEEFDIVLPDATKLVIGGAIPYLGNLVFSPAFILALLCFVFCLVGLIRPLGGETLLGRMKFFIPFYGTIFRYGAVSFFSNSLGILLDRKVPLPDALRLTGHASPSRTVGDFCLQAADETEKGNSLSDAIESFNVFPYRVRWLIGVAEKRGRLPQELMRLAKDYEHHSVVAAARFAQIFEIALIIFTAILVVFVVMSLFLPLIELMKGIK